MKIAKLMLISLTGVLDVLLIAAQILITTTNFKWSPWYDLENGMGIFILTFQLKTIVIVLSILCINLLIKETRLNVKMLLISVVNHIVLLFSFSLLDVSWLLFNMVLIGIIVVSIALIIKILCNTIRGFYICKSVFYGRCNLPWKK
ncbi:hypothetical protein CLRAG_16270 [Clostridium ragsdalei P11]|uniref:Uncharacterized protein n=1 Tax=Clostridium ragsdalei P11 TaxID=1353534 RepID=A0A1A6AVX1_9CLOT|nr:hypothetical protein [Clostridium ragsdalei]OBR94236.1 hypothetical protein CLRAG_16270 [Clostridium ragsdalei P11]